MEPKKTMASTYNSEQDRMKRQDTHFHPEPRDLRQDSDYPDLTDNDCWFYQNELERTLRANLPETMNKRQIQMLWHLGAQARKCNAKKQ